MEKTVGADGRSRTAKPKKKSEAPKSTEPATVAVSSAPVPSSAVFVVHDDPADAGEADPPARATTLDKQVLANDLMRTLRAVLALGTAREIWAAIETAPNRGEIKLVLDRVHQLIVDLHSRYSGAVP